MVALIFHDMTISNSLLLLSFYDLHQMKAAGAQDEIF